ncbi:MAG: alanyl-tRNA editing protein, partial [Pseudomonadota bacterium]
MTRKLFLEDAYLKEADAVVTGHTEQGGLVVDKSIFYATGGGQPGDAGTLSWNGRSLSIATAVKIESDLIALVPEGHAERPATGTHVTQSLDWAQRFRHMRVHTALHLLSVVIPLPVTGGSIGAEKGRLDFDMAEPPEDKSALEKAL